MYTRLPAFAYEILFSILHEHKNRVITGLRLFNRIHIKFTPNLTRLSNQVNVHIYVVEYCESFDL